MSIIEAPRPVEIEAPQREVTEADVLERAADLLEEFGWCQRALGSKERGAFCMAGAFFEANCDLGRRWSDGYSALALGVPSLDVVAWNNAPGRTKAEVVAKLREAAARAREAA